MDGLRALDVRALSFEWDDAKERINFTKHGIHFSTAARVFRDPRRMIREDTEHPPELRYNVLGKVQTVLFVVCTIRLKNSVRLISARKATAAEREVYENGSDDNA